MDHKKVIPDNAFNHAKIYIPKSLQHTIALISKADLVISPDTSIVHISATFRRPLVAIYKDAIHNNKLWGPAMIILNRFSFLMQKHMKTIILLNK
ncbi:hypothetical protein G9394_15000 [Proteus vulgaris]|nr:hypothetical protein G9394_15000 [Proteus vulgaris]